jgi:uncharacterized membrane protein YeaQ/YmgE (transglycosylase-associated protein family)
MYMSLGIAVLIGFFAMVIFGSFLILGPLLAGFIAGFLAGEGSGNGAKAGFISGIVGAVILAILIFFLAAGLGFCTVDFED